MNALCYLRLSSKDQSKSLEYQESTIRNYCDRNGLNMLDVFKANGERRLSSTSSISAIAGAKLSPSPLREMVKRPKTK